MDFFGAALGISTCIPTLRIEFISGFVEEILNAMVKLANYP